MPPVQQIPLGVADAEAGVACIALPEPALEAIELDSGRVRWHVPGPLVPLAIARDRVLVRRDDELPYVLALELRDLADGAMIARTKPIVLPRSVDLRDERTSLDVVIEGETFIVRWASEPLYRGGAPPGAKVLAARAPATSGAFRIDEALNVAPTEAGRPEATGPLATASVGSRVLALTPDALLEARDGDTGAKLWEKAIVAQTPPPKLRP